MSSKRKIFISKSKEETIEFEKFCKSINCELISHTFLSFESIDFEFSKIKVDVIFFGSKRAVDFFLQKESIPKNFKVACVGEGTANQLKLHGYKADFIGKQSGEVELTSLEFKKWLNDRRVVFILAENSNKSFSKSLPKSQFLETVVYKTIISPSTIEECNVYIFTSPSNVEGFMKTNHFSKKSILIAWGSTTNKYLITKNCSVDFTLKVASLATLEHLISNQKLF